MISPLVDDPRLRDFRNFVWLGFQHLRLSEPSWITMEMATFLQHGADRLMLKAWRGAGKSWLASLFCAWSWAVDPTLKIMVVSAGKERADEFSTFLRDLVGDWDLLAELRPEVGKGRDSVSAWDVKGSGLSHSPSLRSIGIGGQTTGKRAGLIVADDVESRTNSDTPGKRQKVQHYFGELPSILAPNGRICVLGTSHSEESLYHTLAEKGYTVHVWPAQYPDPALSQALGDTLSPETLSRLQAAPALAGTPLEPARFGALTLSERRAELGETDYRTQFLLDPRMADQGRYPLRLSDLVVMDLRVDLAPEMVVYGSEPNLRLPIPCLGLTGDAYHGPRHVSDRWIPYTGKVLFVDPAGRGSNETAWSVVGALDSQLFLLARGVSLTGSDTATMQAITACARKNRVSHVQVESNFGDGMFTQLLLPYLNNPDTGWPCQLEEIKHNAQKERRIVDTLEPVLSQHRLIVDRQVLIEDQQEIPGIPTARKLLHTLAYQISRITKDRGCLSLDDRVDSLAGAVGFWAERMNLDRQKQQAARKDAEMDAEVRRFLDHAIGRLPQPQTANWLSGLLPHRR